MSAVFWLKYQEQGWLIPGNKGLTRQLESRYTIMEESCEKEEHRNSCAEQSGDEKLSEQPNNQQVQNEDGEGTRNDNNKNYESAQEIISIHSNPSLEVVSAHSSSKSSEGILDEVHCIESLPSSDSNKENINSNVLRPSYVDFDPPVLCSEYDNTDEIPLLQLLKIHGKHLVSGFEFGEATKRRAQENMKTARDKKKSENRKSGELSVTDILQEDTGEANKPCCSKTISEAEHKTPHSRKRQRLAESKVNPVSSEEFSKATRLVPKCIIKHPECKEVWMYMIFKEEAAHKLRNPRLFNDFKSVTPRMRAILLDWLMEVAAVYHLRRVTYYLSVDYFDRFLSIRPDIPKSLLQLVGITCLYIAAKVEEIYPPNLAEFSYVCDGACKAKEMVSCELLILNSLGWEVVLTTPTDWLNLYMQLHFKTSEIVRSGLSLDFNRDFIFPQYSAYQFTRASQLMDLMSLDPGFLKFSYSIIAAAAMYYMYGEDIALGVSGLSWEQLKPCVDYMEVFNKIIEDAPDPRLRSCLGRPHPEEANRSSGGLAKVGQKGLHDENYSFQTHVASMEYFENATIYRLTRHTRQAEVPSSQPHTPEAPATTTDYEAGEHLPAGGPEDDINPTLDLSTLEELARTEDIPDLNSDENLMSLDEIFELILSQDDTKSSNEC